MNITITQKMINNHADNQNGLDDSYFCNENNLGDT